MTRFTITLEEGVNLVLKTLDTMIGGEIVVPKIPSFRIVDLTKAIDSKKNILITGIRPGEKIHEEMITTSDSLNTVEFKTFYIIMPNSEFISPEKLKEYKVFIKKNGAKKVLKNFCYNSQNNKNFLSIKEIEKLIVSTTKK